MAALIPDKIADAEDAAENQIIGENAFGGGTPDPDFVSSARAAASSSVVASVIASAAVGSDAQLEAQAKAEGDHAAELANEESSFGSGVNLSPVRHEHCGP